MNLTPLFDAGPVIVIHVATALAALLLGGFVLWRRKGTPQHKRLGKVWVGLMVIVSLSSFFIHELKVWGNFSPIHLLSVITLVSLVGAIYAVRKGNISAHQKAMKGTFIGGLVVAGSFSFMPGRIFYRVLFEETGYGVVSRYEAITLIMVAVAGSYLFLRWLDARESKT